MESSRWLSRKARRHRPCYLPMENTAMYNYLVLECLVAFAIVFSIGYLVADSNSRVEGQVPKNQVART